MPHLVCIISDQAVPNLLFIRQFSQPDSEFFFVTTQKMEDRDATDHLIQALHLPHDKCYKIIIDANNAKQIDQQLKAFPFPKESSFLVNITGGNKLMSQMVFTHFQGYDSSMFYSPIDSDQYQQVYPEVINIQKDQSIKLTLDEYLFAYGYEITGELPYFKGNPKPTTLFKKVVESGGASHVAEIVRASSQDYKEEDKNYLQGNWFEFYCYQFFKRIFRLGDAQIGCSVGLKKIGSQTVNQHDNEFDLMFIYQNDLYVFECKVYSSPNYKKEKFQAPMYKLASLTQKFGLKCKKYLAILAELPEQEDTRDQLGQLRANLGIDKLITLEDFKNHQGIEILKREESEKPDFQEKLNLLMEKFNG
ncbi:DUF1887 family protein [Algoriphagus kandeliae]|uniref:DUF1887 family protein n=1 Tax=Algoriphagus kandeliae TaxID=2562278 RepID=A0A4Y9QQI1_9BACT|nr:DUF1887 family CARF protein [Algoriphagus kandeliae]TFV94470.1 DUF1887 family protein [Algoriphagus kandeliae]